MANVSLTLPPDYWKTFSPGKKDLEFISTYLFENETPLTEKEIVPVLVKERVRIERDGTSVTVAGRGLDGLREPAATLDATMCWGLDVWPSGQITEPQCASKDIFAADQEVQIIAQ